MKDHSIIVLRQQVRGRTPVRFGVNIEVQDHHESTNLWDWVADSGITVAREFHPEQTLRRRSVEPGTWGRIASREDFEAFRKRIIDDPDGPMVQWDNYAFDTALPWLGVPDGIIGKLNALEIMPLISLGYGTAHFPRPLIRDIDTRHVPDDAGLDWEAAASAYEYYFAVIWHYASRYGGRCFMMLNEPENRRGWFHLPEDLAAMGWADLFWHAGEATIARYADILSAQYAVLARLARTAMEDVRTLLDDASHAADLQLCGPTSVYWQPLWEAAGEYLDMLDFHHYHPDRKTFPSLYSAVAASARKVGRQTAITEFNRYSGGVPVDRMLFSLDSSLETARLIQTVLGMNGTADPPMAIATFYLLHFPSTHRNYKHLLYGDMNMVDWGGTDRALWNRGSKARHWGEEAWYPSFQEQQVRFATPAYFMFRMLARCARDAAGNPGPFDVLEVGLVNPTSSGPQDLHDQLELFAVAQPDRTIINLINPTDRPAHGCRLDPAWMEQHSHRHAILRQTSAEYRDHCLAGHEMTHGPFDFTVPAKAFTQIILTSEPLEQINSLALKEQTHTPGDTAALSLHQTTRLRAIAHTADRTDLDVSDLNIIWTSSDPDVVRVEQGGLVQRIRDVPGPITIRAATCDGHHAAEIAVS